jgi:hypothetical protein
MPLQWLTAIKAHVVSDDGSHVAIAFETKDGGEFSAMIPANCLDVLISALTRAKSAIKSKKPEDTNRVSVKAPKTWMVLTNENVVLVIFDPKTEDQIGYALDPQASKKMAAALTQNAEGIEKHRAANKT